MSSARLHAFPIFDDPAWTWAASSGFRLDRKAVEQCFSGESFADRIARALAERRAIKVKELIESFEVALRVRRRVRAKIVADVCCGHGLTGLVLAAIEPAIEEVVLVDRVTPKSAGRVLEAVCEVAPHVAGKVRRVESDLSKVALPLGTSVVAVHACGKRTDRVLEVAVALGGKVAVLPCCYAHTSASRPLRAALGSEVATDVHRTYWLEARGYRVEWDAIAPAITPMNRLLIGRPPGT